MKTQTFLIPLTYLLMLVYSNIFASEHAHHHKQDHESHPQQTIVIEQAVARETPPGAKVGAGYLSITNTGKQADTLISLSGEIAPIIQIHTMTQDGDVLRMQQLKNGLVIPAGKTVQLTPGGQHLMFMNLEQQLKAGEEYTVTLEFAQAGKIVAVFPVKKINTSQSTHNKHKH